MTALCPTVLAMVRLLMGPPLAHVSLAGRAPTAASSTALGMESHRAASACVTKDSLAPTVPVLFAWIIAVSTVSA